MFWRRGRKKSEEQAQSSDAQGAEDDITKLQRQFGIKTVSDKDVESEFLQLLGGKGKGNGGMGMDLGLSPRSQLALFGGGDGADSDDEEAKILRELNVTGGIDSISVDDFSDEDDDEDDGEGAKAARLELRGVIDDARRSAKQANALSQGDAVERPVGGASRERIHELKLRAVALKREGNLQEALSVFREVKMLEAQLAGETDSGMAVSSGSSSRTVTSTVVTSSGPVVAVAQVRSTVSYTADYHEDEEKEEKGVEVTDDDMENPEYLAQLAALGLAPGPSHSMGATVDQEETIKSLKRVIHETKERAVQLKRSNHIADALAEMRKIKELEQKLAELQAKQSTPATLRSVTQVTVSTAGVHSGEPVAMAALPIATHEDVEVTDDDMNDPAFAAELLKMGFNPTAMDEEEEDKTDSSVQAAPQLSHSSQKQVEPVPPPRVQYVAYRYSAVDDTDLIGEFDNEDDDNEFDDKHRHQYGMLAVEPVGVEDAKPTVSVAEIQNPPLAESEPTPSNGSTIEELQAQLQRVKLSAVQHKRQGNLDNALEMMRRMKQIENLIEMKRRQPPQNIVAAVVPAPSPQQIARDREFHVIEALLVQFANDATREAKEQLSINRAKAAEWLTRRKEYSAQLALLRNKRQIPGQEPPSIQTQQVSEQIEVELTEIPADQVQLQILSINDLKQAAGKDVFVKFNLSFPSNAPHEGKSGVARISTSSPFGSGRIPSDNAFQVNVQRSRGTQRLFEIKKATFEVWRQGSMLRNPEFIARGYQELAPLLTTSEIRCHVPFMGPNRKPVGGDVEIALRLRTPLRDKQYRTLVTEILQIGEYPPLSPPPPQRQSPVVYYQPTPAAPGTRPPSHSEPATPYYSNDPRPHSQSDASLRVATPENTQAAAPLPYTKSALAIAVPTPPPPQQARRSPVPAPATSEPAPALEDPHDLDLIISYDVINDQIERIEAMLPQLHGDAAAEYSDRLDALGLKKQMLEIDMQTEKLTLDMYVAKLRQRIIDDRQIIMTLMKNGRKPDAARVLRRVKLMEKELEGADGDPVDTHENA